MFSHDAANNRRKRKEFFEAKVWADYFFSVTIQISIDWRSWVKVKRGA
jgi:hypothetical protein